MNTAKYFWDLNKAALRDTLSALKDPAHSRFPERMVTLLSRCDKPKELFSLLPRQRFVENWPRIRFAWLKRARQSVHRDWWETIYEQMMETPGKRLHGRPSELFRHVGKAMKERRTELGLSQKQVATQTRISQPIISQIEDGKKNITLLTLLRLCRALQIKSLDVGS
jgi:DNA-binding XRE family transcriptional regulator